MSAIKSFLVSYVSRKTGLKLNVEDFIYGPPISQPHGSERNTSIKLYPKPYVTIANPIIVHYDRIHSDELREFVLHKGNATTTRDLLLLINSLYNFDFIESEIANNILPDADLRGDVTFRLEFEPSSIGYYSGTHVGTTQYINPLAHSPIPPPVFTPYGELLGTYCSGTNKYGNYSDGEGGYYSELLESGSVDCALPTLVCDTPSITIDEGNSGLISYSFSEPIKGPVTLDYSLLFNTATIDDIGEVEFRPQGQVVWSDITNASMVIVPQGIKTFDIRVTILVDTQTETLEDFAIALKEPTAATNLSNIDTVYASVYITANTYTPPTPTPTETPTPTPTPTITVSATPSETSTPTATITPSPTTSTTSVPPPSLSSSDIPLFFSDVPNGYTVAKQLYFDTDVVNQFKIPFGDNRYTVITYVDKASSPTGYGYGAVRFNDKGSGNLLGVPETSTLKNLKSVIIEGIFDMSPLLQPSDQDNSYFGIHLYNIYSDTDTRNLNGTEIYFGKHGLTPNYGLLYHPIINKDLQYDYGSVDETDFYNGVIPTDKLVHLKYTIDVESDGRWTLRRYVNTVNDMTAVISAAATNQPIITGDYSYDLYLELSTRVRIRMYGFRVSYKV